MRGIVDFLSSLVTFFHIDHDGEQDCACMRLKIYFENRKHTKIRESVWLLAKATSAHAHV